MSPTTRRVNPANPANPDACDVFHLRPAKVAALKRGLLADDSVLALAETFKLLGDATRVRILDAVSRAELCVCDLARLLGISASAVSHQLRLLRGVRLVRPRRAGRMVFYTLDDQHIVGLFEQGLSHVEERAGHAVKARPRQGRSVLDTRERHGASASAPLRQDQGRLEQGRKASGGRAPRDSR